MLSSGSNETNNPYPGKYHHLLINRNNWLTLTDHRVLLEYNPILRIPYIIITFF